MPRTNNTREGFANRMIEKFVAIRSEHVKYLKVRNDLAKISKDSPTYSMMIDYLRKIETDRASLVTTILGMHEKLVTEDFAKFVEFAEKLASDVSDDASSEYAELLAKVIVE